MSMSMIVLSSVVVMLVGMRIVVFVLMSVCRRVLERMMMSVLRRLVVGISSIWWFRFGIIWVSRCVSIGVYSLMKFIGLVRVIVIVVRVIVSRILMVLVDWIGMLSDEVVLFFSDRMLRCCVRMRVSIVMIMMIGVVCRNVVSLSCDRFLFFYVSSFLVFLLNRMSRVEVVVWKVSVSVVFVRMRWGCG